MMRVRRTNVPPGNRLTREGLAFACQDPAGYKPVQKCIVLGLSNHCTLAPHAPHTPLLSTRDTSTG